MKLRIRIECMDLIQYAPPALYCFFTACPVNLSLFPEAARNNALTKGHKIWAFVKLKITSRPKPCFSSQALKAASP